MGQVFSLTLKEASRISKEIFKIIKEDFPGKAVSISFVNNSRVEIFKAVMDGAIDNKEVDDKGVYPIAFSEACLKAGQATWTGKSTKVTRDEVENNTKTIKFLGIRKTHFVPWAGGVPIYDTKGHLLGGVGISGLLHDEEDHYVAETAILKSGFKIAP